MAKDSAGPIPMPPPASASVSTDQQVPSTEASVPHSAPAPPPAPEPVRDPNTIALEKLEQIKQILADLEQQVEAFTGSNRHDRSYKLLDEQALKIMIRCDELVDVSADIKEKRKEMIRNVERVIGKLESKVPATPAAESNSNPMESSAPTSSLDGRAGAADAREHQNSNKKSSSSPSPAKESLPTSATEQSASTWNWRDRSSAETSIDRENLRLFLICLLSVVFSCLLCTLQPASFIHIVLFNDHQHTSVPSFLFWSFSAENVNNNESEETKLLPDGVALVGERNTDDGRCLSSPGL